MLYVIPDHGSHFLEVNLITTSLNVLHLLEEAFDVFLIEVTHEVSKESHELTVDYLVLSLEKKLEEIENKVVGVHFDIIDDHLHCLTEVSILKLVSLLFKLG